MILLDTSGLLAALDSSQRSHPAAAACLEEAEGPLLLSPFVLAELDYLLARRVGEAARMALLSEVGRGAYQLQAFSAAEIAEAVTLIERHRDLGISLSDASIAVLAVRHGTDRVLTLDERHFRVIGPGARPFRLLPADA